MVLASSFPPDSPEPALVSVILVLWNCDQELSQCLHSVESEAASVPLEVICVDNASEDGSVGIARKHGATVVELGTNAGFPVAVNIGLSHAAAPYVLLLNPDVELQSGSLARCLRELQGQADIGIVGCNLRRPDGSPDRAAARQFRSLSAIALETFGITRLNKRLDRQYLPGWARADSRDVECINGAFMLVRRDFLRSRGGLDDAVFMYLEDQELCRQACDEGLRVRFVADALATHVGSASTLRASAPRRTTAYLHRLDADIELVARRRGSGARIAAIALFAIRAVFGLLVGVATGDRDLRFKYRSALRWLARQLPGRMPPPPVR